MMLIHALATAKNAALKIPIQAVLLNSDKESFSENKLGAAICLTGHLAQDAKEVLQVAKTLYNLAHPEEPLVMRAHIHFKAHEFLKNGSSWGVCAYLLLLWLSHELPYLPGISATGVIDLAGNIINPGGLQEKVNIWKASSSESDTLLLPGPFNLMRCPYGKGRIACLEHVSQINQIIKQLIGNS